MSYRKQLALYWLGSAIVGFLLGPLLYLLAMAWYVRLAIVITVGVALTLGQPVNQDRMQKP